MAGTIHVTYLFDPLCGWCYGAAATLEKLAARPGVMVELAPTGLFAGDGARPMDEAFAAYAWSNDERIARLTGQPFSQVYRRDVLGDRTRPFDSAPATLALVAVALVAPERELEALKAVQKTRYVEGGDVTDAATLSQVLRSLKLDAAADRLAEPDDALLASNRERIEAARTAMRRFGATGVPALIVGIGDNRRILQASALFDRVDVLMERLRAA